MIQTQVIGVPAMTHRPRANQLACDSPTQPNDKNPARPRHLGRVIAPVVFQDQ